MNPSSGTGAVPTAPSGAFSVAETARIVGVPEHRLRYWAQTGFVVPSRRDGGRPGYAFRDLVAVKVAKALLDAGLPLQRVRRSLDALRAGLPDDFDMLARVRVRCDHDRVIVQDRDLVFEPITGQLLLDFDVGTLEEQAATLLELSSPRGSQEIQRTAYGWFLMACEHERAWDGQDGSQESFRAAKHAYERALELDPEFAAAWTNLGGLVARVGDINAARDHFDEALRCDPEQPEAQANLAELALRSGDFEVAIAGYRQLLRSSPDYLDGDYGLARALLAVGGKAQALAHLERFCAAVDAMPSEERSGELEQRASCARSVAAKLRFELFDVPTC